MGLLAPLAQGKQEQPCIERLLCTKCLVQIHDVFSGKKQAGGGEPQKSHGEHAGSLPGALRGRMMGAQLPGATPPSHLRAEAAHLPLRGPESQVLELGSEPGHRRVVTLTGPWPCRVLTLT